MYRKFLAFVSILMLIAILPSVASAAEGRFERTLKVTAAPDVEVTTGSGDVTIRTGDTGSIRIVGRIHGSGWFSDASQRIQRIEQNPPIVQVGNAIRIGHFSDPSLQRGISISYDITLPASSTVRCSTGSGGVSVEGVTGSLKVGTGSGDVRLARIAGDIRAYTGSGGISVSGASGRFEGRTGSGDVQVSASQLTHADVVTGSGGIRVEDVRGGLRARTGSGDVRASGAATSSWDVHTGSGSIQVSLPSTSGFDLDASASSGSINVARQVTMQGEINRHHIRGRVGGGGPTITLHTSSGDIRVQ